MQRPYRAAVMRRSAIVLATALGATTAAAAVDPTAPIDGTTAAGDRVRLYPNGRWEYVEAKKADAQRPVVEAYDRDKSLEQGGILGIGRKIKPGDPDYNRGSLGGKSH